MTDLDTVDWQLPLDMSEAEMVADGKGEEPLTYRKRILPLGEINYQGQKVQFNRALHDDLAEAFAGKAFDGVPLILDGPMGHNAQDAGTGRLRDPERVRGWATDMGFEENGEEGPGTYATLQFPDKKAARSIRKNPFLGVSARIKPNHTRQDGTTERTFRHAVMHILATTVPRVTGLGAFKPISLAEDDEREVVDLSGKKVKELSVPKKTKAVEPEADLDLGPLGDLDLAELDNDALLALFDKMTEEVQADIDLAESQTDDEAEVEPEVTVDLALQSRVEAMEQTNAVLQAQLAEARWKNEAIELAEDGVPPFLINEAARVLSLPGTAEIDLADDDEDPLTIARMAVRTMLDASRGMVDLASEAKGYTAPQTELDADAVLAAEFARQHPSD